MNPNFSEMILPLKWMGLLTALLCGIIVGLERQLSGKPVGIRTCCLICLGTCTFVCVGQSIPNASDDLPRIIGQIITGIGFLGAGVILTREGVVIGITSAAVIWVLAGIGILVSMDHYSAAIMLSLVVVLVLRGVSQLEKLFTIFRVGIYARFHKHKKNRNESV